MNPHLPIRPFDTIGAFPAKVVVMIEASCAAKCPSCPFSAWNSPIRANLAAAGTGSLDRQVAEKLAYEIGQYGAWMHVTGAGEPFQYPHQLASLISMAKLWGAKTWINTHGNLVGPDVANRLLLYLSDVTEFSVDAADEKTYSIVRRGLSWNLLLSNIDGMVRMRDRLKSTSRIIVSIILQDALHAPSEQHFGKLGERFNAGLPTRLTPGERVEEIKQFWLARGVDHVSFRKFLTWGAQTSVKQSHAILPDAYLHPEDGEPCPYPFERMGVDSTGRIVICNADITGQTDFGNLHDREVTIAKAWNSEAMQKARALHACGRGREASAACRSCSDWAFRSWTHNYASIDERTRR